MKREWQSRKMDNNSSYLFFLFYYIHSFDLRIKCQNNHVVSSQLTYTWTLYKWCDVERQPKFWMQDIILRNGRNMDASGHHLTWELCPDEAYFFQFLKFWISLQTNLSRILQWECDAIRKTYITLNRRSISFLYGYKTSVEKCKATWRSHLFCASLKLRQDSKGLHINYRQRRIWQFEYHIKSVWNFEL